MTLRKKNGNSVNFIPQTKQSQERDNKPNGIKNGKQNKKLSQDNKKSFKDYITGEEFRLNK